jgi:ATP-dependent RNA helicase DeaD
LPMICRRGGIDKQDIGAIRILDTTTEFEISGRVADSFAVKIRRPDKEDNIRIEPLGDAPQDRAPPEKRLHTPQRDGKQTDRDARQNSYAHDERGPKRHGKSHNETDTRSENAAGFNKKKRHQDKPAHARHPQLAGASPVKPAFGKKTKKAKNDHRR